MGHFWFILGRRVSHFGPRDGRFSPILAIFGRQDARSRSNLERQLYPSWLTRERKLVNFDRIGGGRWANFGSFRAAQSATLGPRTAYFRQFLAISGASRRPISAKLGPLTRPILVDTGAQKWSIFVELEAVSGPILVHFGPQGQPLWAPGRPIFANFGQFWGAKTPNFSRT